MYSTADVKRIDETKEILVTQGSFSYQNGFNRKIDEQFCFVFSSYVNLDVRAGTVDQRMSG